MPSLHAQVSSLWSVLLLLGPSAGDVIRRSLGPGPSLVDLISCSSPRPGHGPRIMPLIQYRCAYVYSDATLKGCLNTSPRCPRRSRRRRADSLLEPHWNGRVSRAHIGLALLTDRHRTSESQTVSFAHEVLQPRCPCMSCEHTFLCPLPFGCSSVFSNTFNHVLLLRLHL
jgi:hypothetical protein